ncbi:MAG: DUF6383 domain-containing protein [Bacteroidales bacterium]
MKRILQKNRIIILVACALLASTTLSAKDWFVKPNASGTGASWDDPCNVGVISGTPAGLIDGDVVHIAAGVYQRSTSLTLTKYVTVIGGYASNLTGTTIPTSRALATDSTIFEPSAGGTARCFNINATTSAPFNKIVIDGLNFKGFNMATGNGGTALNITSSQSDIDLKNLNFVNNISLNANGGAASMANFAYNVTVSFDNCHFIGNQATWTTGNGYGGAFFCNNGSTNPKIFNFTNCTFKNNTAYGRAGALYFTSLITCNITDCLFDTNYCMNATDNTSSGGCIYVAGGTQSNTVNVVRSIFVNSSCTAKGSVFWFNTIPKNYLNLTDCSLIGNYAKRKSSARAAIDADNYANLDVVLNNCVLSNYNNKTDGTKQSKAADLMPLNAATNGSTSSTFTNTILNGYHFTTIRNNTFDALSPDTLYKSTGFLADSTINLALSGELKITNKIVFAKTFAAAEGLYVHTQIFDVKRLMGLPLTLIATIPDGYALSVDGTDYQSGVNAINIPVSGANPVIIEKLSSGITRPLASHVSIVAQKGAVRISGVNEGDRITIFNLSGQAIASKVADANTVSIPVSTGFIAVKVSSAHSNQVFKVIAH